MHEFKFINTPILFLVQNVRKQKEICESNINNNICKSNLGNKKSYMKVRQNNYINESYMYILLHVIYLNMIIWLRNLIQRFSFLLISNRNENIICNYM